jgi:hypothetical protein
MDLGKFVELLASTPGWFKLAVGAWIISGALLFVRFLTFPPQTKPSSVDIPGAPTAQTSLSSPIHELPANVDLSPESYFTKLEQLKGRFLERDEYLKSLNGKSVKWKGIVHNVRERSSYISIVLDCEHDGNKGLYISVPLSLKTKAFSLHAGDLVEIPGTLDVSSPTAPSIDGQEIILIKAASPNA